MKLSPIDIYSSIFLPENLPDDLLYHFAKVLGKNENRCKTATFEQIIDWSIDAVIIPDKIENWNVEHYSLFARFLNPEMMEWRKSQLLTAWNFIRDVLQSGLSFNNQITYAYPTPQKPKSISPLLTYSICSRIRPVIFMRGRTLEELYPVARAILFSGSISGLLETFQQTLSLSLLTTSDPEPIINLMKQFDETTKIVAKNVKRQMARSDRFTFIRHRIDDDIQERMDMGYYSLEGTVAVPKIEHESQQSPLEVRGVNRFSFYDVGEIDENYDFFQMHTNLPLLTMSLIGNNLNDFEFGNHYAICLKNKQLPPNAEMGRESICSMIRAAYYHNRDITSAEFPENVMDREMQNYPFLSQSFNAKIPPQAYPLYVLKELAYKQGIIENTEVNYDEYELHEMLQLEQLNPQFYMGMLEPYSNEKTIFLEDVTDIENPISYGCKIGCRSAISENSAENVESINLVDRENVGGSVENWEDRQLCKGSFYIFDPEELASYFNSTGILQNPASEKVEYFTPTAIRQLLHMLESVDLRSSLYKLKSAIETIVAKIGSLEMKLQEFYNLYTKASESEKEKIKQLVILVHEIGMSMRGWIPNNDKKPNGGKIGTNAGKNKIVNKGLPIEEAVFDDYLQVEEQTNKSIGSYLQYIEMLRTEKSNEGEGEGSTNIVDCFSTIPIWKYRVSSNTGSGSGSRGYYLRPNHEADTIGKRVELVLKGEHTGRDENSCIRLSSNYFCATSYRLAKIINLSLGYDINNLREIS